MPKDGKKQRYRGTRERRERTDRETNESLNASKNGRKNEQPSEGETKTYIDTMSYRGLPKSSYSIQANPYDAANETATMYPMIMRSSQLMGSVYGGVQNIDSGLVQQYPLSQVSGLLDYVDVVRTRLSLNYRYVPVTRTTKTVEDATGEVGKVLVDKMRNSIAEAVSTLGASTFTSQEWLNYAIETDMYCGSGQTITEDGKSVYTNVSDTLYLGSMFYQIMIQNMLQVFSKMNRFRGAQFEMYMMSFEREVAQLNSLLGLFNKTSFIALFDALVKTIQNEYFDLEWFQQSNMITNLMSRRSPSMIDPLCEIDGFHAMPKTFKLYYRTAPNQLTLIYDFSKPIDGVNPLDVPALFRSYEEKVSPYDTLKFIRNINSAEIKDATFNSRFNGVSDHLNKFVGIMDNFKTRFADLRTVFDTLQRTGVVTWQKGYSASIIKDTNVPVPNFILTTDILKNIMTGPDKVTYNDRTQRWASWCMWNLYNGIPGYAARNGGAFIAFSAKDFDISKESLPFVEYIPLAYYVDQSMTDDQNTYLHMLNRAGKETKISTKVHKFADTSLSYLAPLPVQKQYDLRLPYFESAKLENSEQCVVTALIRLFGYASIKTTSGINKEVYMADPDLFAVYDYEIESFINDSVAYARANGPFRGTSQYSSIFGFMGIEKKNK